MKVELRNGFLIFEEKSAVRLADVMRVWMDDRVICFPDERFVQIHIRLRGQTEFKTEIEHKVVFHTMEEATEVFKRVLYLIGKEPEITAPTADTEY